MGKEPLYPHVAKGQSSSKQKSDWTKPTLEEIHESLVNGQREQMVRQIKEYGLYDFWEDYRTYLYERYDMKFIITYFTDATISYSG